MLYNPALLINDMILFGDTLLNMSVNVKLFSNKINLKKSYSIQSIRFATDRVRIDLCIDKHQCMRLNNQKHPSIVQISLQNQHVRFQKFPYDWVTNKK